MDNWLNGGATYQKFLEYFGELRPFKDDDPKRLMRATALRGAYAMYRRQAPLRSSGRALITTASGYNQSLVKVIPKGGARSAQGLRDQVAYLTRKHTLRMSDSDLGSVVGEMEKEEAIEKANAWAAQFRGNPKFGHTTHLVVSFPRGTDELAAKKAGEAFADRAFSQSLGGDCFDYMTVQHTDTEYPHTHILVRNRGLHENGWFSIKRGSAHEPSVLRALQAEVSAQYGIRLTATTRLERGIKERAVTTPEYRLAKAEGRMPRPKPLTSYEDVVLDALIDDRASAYTDIAETLSDDHRDIKAALTRARNLLKQGDFIVPKPMIDGLKGRSVDELLDVLEKDKQELSAQLKLADNNLKKIKDPSKRADFDALLGKEKERAAKHFPERMDLQIYARGEDIHAFPEGYQFESEKELRLAHPKVIAASYEAAEKNIRAKAGDLGIDADEVLARYKVSSAVRHETARRWHLEELRDVTQKRPDIGPDEARKTVVDFHAYVRDELRKANRTIATDLRAQNVELSSVLPRESSLPKHALNPFDEIMPKPVDRPDHRPKPEDELKPRLRPRP